MIGILGQSMALPAAPCLLESMGYTAAPGCVLLQGGGAAALAQLDREPTPATLAFEAVVILGTIALLWILSRFKRSILLHYAIVAVGVLTFEIFTAPMWNNDKLGVWAYVYKDVSWVLTLGWSSMILGTIFLVDRFLPGLREWQRFVAYLAVLTVLTSIAESVVVAIGIRSYAPEVMAVIAGSMIPGTNISFHLLYYVPVFLSLVIAFYRYWAPLLDQSLIPRPVPTNWLLSFVIAFVGVFFFEVMIEPMVVNAKFPSWSYVYHDISVVQTLFWIVLIWFATNLIDKLLPRLDPIMQFVLYMVVLSVVAYPVESWLINDGFRVYGPSATENFSGLRTIITNIPIEVALAIPLYLGLIISFVRYWEAATQGRASEVFPRAA